MEYNLKMSLLHASKHVYLYVSAKHEAFDQLCRISLVCGHSVITTD